MLTKREKNVLMSGNAEEIKDVLKNMTGYLSKDESLLALNKLTGRGFMNFEIIPLLAKRRCDFNMPLNDSGYRVCDYLASYGRLSPRLINEFHKAGYDFCRDNSHGEHCGFYLAFERPISSLVVSALKNVNVDFESPNNNGKTAVDMYMQNMQYYGRKIMFPLLSGMKREEYVDFLHMNQSDVKTYISSVIEKIPSEANAHIGIAKVDEDLSMRMNIGCCVSRAIASNKTFEKAQELRKWEELQNKR